MSSSVNVDNKKKCILILSEVTSQRLDDRILTTEKNIQLILPSLETNFV